MDMIDRNPSKDNLCRFLKQHINFSYIVDIGVQYDTPTLRTTFIDTPQILVEPVETYHETIINNYSKNKYKLIKKECSKKNNIYF